MTIGTIPIWLDCDPGHDDALAILLSCFCPAFNLLGLSACYGNSSPANTLYNARSLLTAFGKCHEVPIYASAQRPWIREPEYAPDIHGESGLDGTALLPVPKCEIQTGKSYMDAMEYAIVTNRGEITVVATGALTSIATLLRDRPHLKKMIKYISIMGGGIEVGNRNENQSAEFNIWIDPHAANFIFQDPEIKNKCILLPLNMTHKAIATKQIGDLIRGDDNSKLRQLFYELIQFFAHTYKDKQGFEQGPPTHDPLTLMPLLELYGWEPSSVIQFDYRRMDLYAIEDSSSPDSGKTCIEKEYELSDDKGIMVCFNMNVKFFWEQILLALEQAEKSSAI